MFMVLALCMLVNYVYFLSADFFSKITFSKKSFRNTMRVLISYQLYTVLPISSTESTVYYSGVQWLRLKIEGLRGGTPLCP